jgi:hypothetical protein
MLGLDDIAWDQEVLLGDSSQPGFGLGGFKFEPNRLSFGLTPSKSGLGSQVCVCVWGGGYYAGGVCRVALHVRRMPTTFISAALHVLLQSLQAQSAGVSGAWHW